MPLAEPPSSQPEPTPSEAPVSATERVLAGFCHDLNGQLANAMAFAYLLGPDADAEGPGRHLREALDRMEELVRRLRWLVRDEDRTPEPTSLGDLLGALMAILPLHGRFRHAELQVEDPADLPAVRVDFASALRVLLLAVDAGTAGEAGDGVELTVRMDPEQVWVGPAGTGVGPMSARAALDRELAEAGLAREGGDGVAPLRIALPRLG